MTIAFAESATAGCLCSEFALAPESGDILKGGIVCYDATLKETILKVPKTLIDKFTAESEKLHGRWHVAFPVLLLLIFTSL
jgi:nicotinamide-nucleotide amidase